MPFTLEGAQDATAPKTFKLEGAQDATPTKNPEQSKTSSDYAKETGRQVGLTGRYAIQALASPLATVADIPAEIANATRWAGDKALGIPQSSNAIPEQNYALSKFLSNIGLPEPANTQERIVGDVAQSVIGTGGTIKVAQALSNMATPVAKNIMNLLAANPTVQGVSAATAGAAGGSARESGANPIVQFLASLAGGIAPTGIANIPNATKSLLRGGATSQQINDNIANFKAAGTTPTVGQATEGRTARALETALSKVPGGAGVMQKFAEKQASDIGGGVESTASNLAGKTDPTITGRAIEKGITGNFIPEARKTQAKLYNTLDTFIQPQKEVGVSNFTKAVTALNKPIKGAENLSGTSIFVNNTIKDIQSGLQKDLGGSPAKPSTILDAEGKPFTSSAVPAKTTLPYSAIKQLRTRIGEKLDQYDLSPEISRTELKRLYGALSEDMKAAAKAAGPKAESAFTRANSYTSALHDRIDLLQGVLDKNGGYEKIFKAAMSGTNEGATTLNAVMKALPPEGKKMFTATVLRRMGKANSSNQNDAGEIFSTEKFLTNWNNLDSRAKTALFGNQTKQFNDDITKLSKVASNIRDGSKVFKNPSGTASQEKLLNTITGTELGGAVLGLFLGHPVGALGVGASMAIPNVAAKAMTNPNFVHWLARNSAKPASAYPVAINQLLQLANRSKDNELKDIADELKQSSPSQPEPKPYIRNQFDNFIQQTAP